MRLPARRLLAAALLLALLAGSTVHYGAVGDRHDREMVGQRALAQADGHVGEPVFFWGRVVGTAGDRLVVSAADERVRVLTTRVPPSGSAIQVYGTLGPDRVVTPDRLIVSRSSNLRFLYAISAVGGFLAAAAGLSRWRFDRDRLAFVPREGGQ